MSCHTFSLSAFRWLSRVAARQVGGSETSNASSNAGGPSALFFPCRHTIHSIFVTFCYIVCVLPVCSLLVCTCSCFWVANLSPLNARELLKYVKNSFCLRLRQSAGGSHITKTFLPQENTLRKWWCQYSDRHFAVFIHQNSGGDGQSVYGGV